MAEIIWLFERGLTRGDHQAIFLQQFDISVPNKTSLTLQLSFTTLSANVTWPKARSKQCSVPSLLLVFQRIHLNAPAAKLALHGLLPWMHKSNVSQNNSLQHAHVEDV